VTASEWNPFSIKMATPQIAGLGAEVAATITERCFTYLEAAPVRVTGHDIVYPGKAREAPCARPRPHSRRGRPRSRARAYDHTPVDRR
jgi:pyruvate dehydrogenase E1 component beta subunit